MTISGLFGEDIVGLCACTQDSFVFNGSVLKHRVSLFEMFGYSMAEWFTGYALLIFYSCIQSTDRVQLAKFSKQILREDIPAKQYISEFTDWEKAFHSILDLPYGEKKKLIIIDEYPYMCKGNPSILSILQNLWGYRTERQ